MSFSSFLGAAEREAVQKSREPSFVCGCFASSMDNSEESAIELHGDEEIIEVIDLNDTEPGPGGFRQHLSPLPWQAGQEQI